MEFCYIKRKRFNIQRHNNKRSRGSPRRTSVLGIHVNIPVEDLGKISKISKSMWYDRLEEKLFAR